MARKTKAQNEMRGNPGKRGPNTKEAPPAAAPEMPSWLDDGAQEHWNFLLPLLQQYDLVTELDGAALGAMCAAHSRAVAAEKVLSKKGKDGGASFRSPNGHICQRPEVKIAETSWKAYYQFAEKFGMTPAARAKMGIAPKQQGNNGSDGEDYYDELDD